MYPIPIMDDHDDFWRTVQQSTKALGYVHCQAFSDGTVWQWAVCRSSFDSVPVENICA
jgi:hypothetical protein